MNIKSTELRTTIDQFTNPLDPKLFGYILKECQFLSDVQLWPDQCQPNDIVKFCKSDPDYKSPRISQNMEEALQYQEEVIKLSDQPQVNFPLFEGLNHNLRMSQKLTSIQLIKIQLTDDAWIGLADGLATSKSLRSLTLNQMQLPYHGLDRLADAVMQNRSLEKLDLSMNDMSDEYGTIIAKFVQSQQDQKDLMKWEGSLRGRAIDKQSINEIGLKELILHHNFLSQKFLRSFGQRLKNDNYLRLVDLKFNQFERTDLEEFIENVKSNKSIFALDLRNNVGFHSGIQKRSALIMLKNIELAYKMKRNVKKCWIIKPLIFIEIQEKRGIQSGKLQANFQSAANLQDVTNLQYDSLGSKSMKHQQSLALLSPQSEDSNKSHKTLHTSKSARRINEQHSSYQSLQKSQKHQNRQSQKENNAHFDQTSSFPVSTIKKKKKQQKLQNEQQDCLSCLELINKNQMLESTCFQQQMQIQNLLEKIDGDNIPRQPINIELHTSESQLWGNVIQRMNEVTSLMEHINRIKQHSSQYQNNQVVQQSGKQLSQQKSNTHIQSYISDGEKFENDQTNQNDHDLVDLTIKNSNMKYNLQNAQLSNQNVKFSVIQDNSSLKDSNSRKRKGQQETSKSLSKTRLNQASKVQNTIKPKVKTIKSQNPRNNQPDLQEQALRFLRKKSSIKDDRLIAMQMNKEGDEFSPTTKKKKEKKKVESQSRRYELQNLRSHFDQF
eukprot:403356175